MLIVGPEYYGPPECHNVSRGLDLYYADTDPAQHLATATQDLDDLDRILSFRRAKIFKCRPSTIFSRS